MPRAHLWLGLILLASCSRGHDSFPLPRQRQTLSDPAPVGPFVEMGAVTSPAYIVRDVGPAANDSWRWTYAQPEFRFEAPAQPDVRFVMDFGIVRANFEKTGPVVVSVRIDGKLLGEMRCDTAGDRRFAQVVPRGWLRAGEIVRVMPRVDKRVVASDGVELGFTIFRAGFLP